MKPAGCGEAAGDTLGPALARKADGGLTQMVHTHLTPVKGAAEVGGLGRKPRRDERCEEDQATVPWPRTLAQCRRQCGPPLGGRGA